MPLRRRIRTLESITACAISLLVLHEISEVVSSGLKEKSLLHLGAVLVPLGCYVLLRVISGRNDRRNEESHLLEKGALRREMEKLLIRYSTLLEGAGDAIVVVD